MKLIKSIAFSIVQRQEPKLDGAGQDYLRALIEFEDGSESIAHDMHLYNHVKQADGSWKYEPANHAEKQARMLASLQHIVDMSYPSEVAP